MAKILFAKFFILSLCHLVMQSPCWSFIRSFFTVDDLSYPPDAFCLPLAKLSLNYFSVLSLWGINESFRNYLFILYQMFLTIQTIKTLFLFDIIVRNFSIKKIDDAKIVGTFYLFLCLISMTLRPKKIDYVFPVTSQKCKC